jgi:hypothetical protein
LRGRFPAAQSVLLERAVRDQTFRALAAKHPQVAVAMEKVARRSLPYVKVPRAVLDTIDSSKRLQAVCDCLSLPCDHETYGCMQRLVELEERACSRLVLQENVFHALCDALRAANAGRFTGDEELAPSRPGSPSASPRRCSGTQLARRALALWVGLIESVKLCMASSDAAHAFADAIADSRMVGVICHGVCGIGEANTHRTVRAAAAQLLRVLTTDQGTIQEAMLLAARSQMARICNGFPRIWGYISPALNDSEPCVRWDVAHSIVSLLEDDSLGAELAGRLLSDQSLTSLRHYIAAAFDRGTTDFAEPAATVAIALLGFTRTYAAQSAEFHRGAARTATLRLRAVLKQEEPAPRYTVRGRLTAEREADISPRRATCKLHVDPLAPAELRGKSRGGTADAAEFRERVDARAVACLAQYLSAGLRNKATSGTFRHEIVDCGDVCNIVTVFVTGIEERSRLGRRTRGGLLLGVLGTLRALVDGVDPLDRSPWPREPSPTRPVSH